MLMFGDYIHVPNLYYDGDTWKHLQVVRKYLRSQFYVVTIIINQ